MISNERRGNEKDFSDRTMFSIDGFERSIEIVFTHFCIIFHSILCVCRFLLLFAFINSLLFIFLIDPHRFRLTVWMCVCVLSFDPRCLRSHIRARESFWCNSMKFECDLSRIMFSFFFFVRSSSLHFIPVCAKKFTSNKFTTFCYFHMNSRAQNASLSRRFCLVSRLSFVSLSLLVFRDFIYWFSLILLFIFFLFLFLFLARAQYFAREQQQPTTKDQFIHGII